VIGVDGTLVGVLTQTDVVRALRRFADPVPAAPATDPAH
jgi:CBS domain-containing protein